MPTLPISEFTFGFAFLSEQVDRRWNMVRAVPVLPSLRQESDLGWDAKLPVRGTVFYYQFKLSRFLNRRNARFIRDQVYHDHYYEIRLSRARRNRQHRLLRRLSKTEANTFYVAPECHSIREWESGYLNQRVTELTRLIPVRLCPDWKDGQRHYITFRPGSRTFISHSEASRHAGSLEGKTLGSEYAKSRNSWKPIDAAFSRQLYETVRSEFRHEDESVAGSRADDPWQHRIVQSQAPNRYLLGAARLLAGAGTALVVVGQG